MSTGWVDDFLVIDAIFVFILIFIDWALGKEKRNEIREAVANWYIFLQDNSYGSLVAEDAKRTRNLLINIFGPVTFSGRRLLSCAVFSIGILAILGFIVIVFYGDVGNLALSVYSVIVPNILSNWISISITIALLGVMQNYNNVWLYLGILLLDLAIAMTLFLLASGSTYMSIEIVDPRSDIVSLTSALHNIDEIVVAVTTLLFTAILPTVIHAFYAGYFVISKATRSFLRGPVSLITLRLYESEKGVLTQIAIGLGAVAKLLQQLAKYYVS